MKFLEDEVCRAALLEYLRNLTPQVLLFGLAIFFHQLACVDRSQFCLYRMLFVALAAIGVLASTASGLQFLHATRNPASQRFEATTVVLFLVVMATQLAMYITAALNAEKWLT